MKSSNILFPSKPKEYLTLAIWLGIIAFGGKFVIKDALPISGLILILMAITGIIGGL